MFKAVSRHGFGMGWRPDHPTAHSAPRFTPTAALLQQAMKVARIDLSQLPAMPPVYDQGVIGSCQSNAGVGLDQFVRRKLGLSPDWCGSRLMTYYLVRALEGTIGSDSGGTLREVMHVLINNGVCPEEEWPYDGDTAADATGLFPPDCRAVTAPSAQAVADAALHQVVRGARVQQDVLHMKACLLSGFPFMFGFEVLTSFFDQFDDPLVDIPMPQPGDNEEGGHAVCGVGCDDQRVMPGGLIGAIKCRNSWGPTVQDGGYFWMPYRFISSRELSSDFWTVTKLEA